LLAKICFTYDPNFLLLLVSFLYSIDLHPYSHYRFLKISRPFCGSQNRWIIVVFLQSNSLRITIVSQKYWDLLQPYSHNHFSKILRTFYASKKILNNCSIPSTHAEKKLPIFLINTPLLYIPLLALTDRQNHRQRNKYTCYTWAGGTFFPVVLLCQYLVLFDMQYAIMVSTPLRPVNHYLQYAIIV
jgi:hypothetical protein